jgi:hypothetical protein
MLDEFLPKKEKVVQIQFGFSISPEDMQLLADLAERHDCSKVNVLRAAIRMLHASETK